MADYDLTPTARRDMRAIRQYLMNAPERIRIRQVGELRAAFEQAARFRLSGRREPQLKFGPAEVRSLFSFPYRVYYLPSTHPVQIMAIRHARQEPLARV